MIKVKVTGIYAKMLTDLEVETQDFDLPKRIRSQVKLFRKNPNDTRIRNHKLRGRMSNLYSFSITEDIRIVYEKIGKNTVRFLKIGTHKQVYPKN
ncbi:type II toxin-antitoxin system mRNA interferase toxin, RelE/StbE family [Candidatus Microgenomates bacterium]|nr:MAG: type II toxin-antitoxin system mRNA interferase toxin, RelE/StbE family [Candidatus Microgenomates bacterium]